MCYATCLSRGGGGGGVAAVRFCLLSFNLVSVNLEYVYFTYDPFLFLKVSRALFEAVTLATSCTRKFLARTPPAYCVRKDSFDLLLC